MSAFGGRTSVWKSWPAPHFPVEYGRAYQLTFRPWGDTLSVDVDGVNVLQVQDSTFTSGMVGLGACSMGRTFFESSTSRNCKFFLPTRQRSPTYSLFLYRGARSSRYQNGGSLWAKF